MSNTTISPNMFLPVPTVGTDPGPDWANNLNACLGIVDQHNHSVGSGVQITPNGLNINSDLSINSNNLTSIRSLIPTAQSGTLSTSLDVGNIYTVSSGGQTNLYYNNASGTPIQITSGSSVNAGAGSITGLPSGTASVTYTSSTYVFQSATNTPATVDFGSAVFRNLSSGSFGMTVSPPNSMGANTSIVLPAVPGAQSFMSIDSSGNMAAYAAVSGGITGSNIASQTITASNIANQTITATQIASNTITTTQIASNAAINTGQLSFYNSSNIPYYGANSVGGGGFSTASTSLVHVSALDTGIEAGLVASRPVFIYFSGTFLIGGGSGTEAMTLQIRWQNGGSSGTINTVTWNNPYSATSVLVPASIFNYIDSTASGLTNYQVWISSGSSGITVSLSSNFTMTIVQV